ncbi:LADA_0A08504g1_1 [Lachancea dasiensis]|uniref:Histone-lysine N-methyltransferase SET5 n=1 Tax=Lachancea dasiensis TaxID=1072105 RepID=A0A1G4IQB6_9SACH|nr:LADA_0A08504g1_1 [Lachancea dasiensis]
MPVKLEQLHLNDAEEETNDLKEPKIVPSDKQICDGVVLLWRQEPASEDLGPADLLTRIISRNPQWELSREDLEQVLSGHNLLFTDESKLFTYADEVMSRHPPKPNPKVVDKMELREIRSGRWSFFAAKDLRRDEIIFYEHEPLTPILPLDKASLASKGRSCSLCGQLLTQSSQFTLKNLLDCQACSAVWCSKHCKRLDASTHGFLKHPTSKSKLVSASGWMRFEELCKEHGLQAPYAIGIVYARIILNRQDGAHIQEELESLAEVSQLLRTKAADSTNVGGLFDKTTGAVNSEEGPVWNELFKSFCTAFPQAQEQGFDMDTFLKNVGKYNINQLDGQIFTMYSHLNHKCEPNVRYEFEGKTGLRLFARKDIKKGEELFTTYVNPLHGVTLRRRELLVNYGFLCRCSRCQKELKSRQEAHTKQLAQEEPDQLTAPRRKSSIKASRPDLSELLKNGQEFDLEIPENLRLERRRKSVRFDDRVMVALEE